MSFNVSELLELAVHYQNIWKEAELQLFEKLITTTTKGDGKYMQSKLKTWKKRIKKLSWSSRFIRHALQCLICIKTK